MLPPPASPLPPSVPSPRERSDTTSVLDLIAALVEASLLHAETDPDGTTRYRMLETIREFALERLEASGEADAIRDRHAVYFLAFAERYELGELPPDGDRVMALLETEHANLRVALARLAQADDSRPFLRAAAALGRFWFIQGHYQEGREWLQRALEQGDAETEATRGRALVALGMIEIHLGANPDAERHLTEGLARCRALDTPIHAATALIGLGAVAIARGDQRGSAAFLEEARGAAQAVADDHLAGILMSRVQINLAVVFRARGDHALAVAHLEDALRLVRAARNTEGTILTLGDLGDLARDQGDHQLALARYREALDLGRANPKSRVVTEVVEAVAMVAIALGHAERGARLLGAAAAQRDRLRLRYRVRETEAALEHAVASARATLGDAAFAAARAAGRGLGPRQAVAEALAFDPSFSPVEPIGPLTTREMEILRLLAAGMTDPAIAAALYISVRTVENHVARILAKLAVHTRTAAVSVAIAGGLVEAHRPASADE